MQCNEVRQQLQAQGNRGLAALPVESQTHLTHCAGCQEFAANQQYRSLLQNLPAPAPREGFAKQALEKAWAAREGRNTISRFNAGWGLATAAALVLAIGVVLQFPGPAGGPTGVGSPTQVVTVMPQTVHLVDLLMVSAGALPDAWITLQMDENVSLQGYPGHNTIRWSAPLVAGNNQLTLPVELRGNRNGSIVVQVESGGARKQMLLTVEAETETSQQVAMI